MSSTSNRLHVQSFQRGLIYLLTYPYILFYTMTQPPLPPLPNPCYDLGGCCGCFVFNILPNLSIFSSRLLLLTTFNYPILHRMTWYYIQLNSSIFFHSDFRLAASYHVLNKNFNWEIVTQILFNCLYNSFLGDLCAVLILLCCF